ncbi:Membrane associated secretion system protein [Moritella viscosa]|uniref:vWA domain-containing protein n=1 Tax=Moritella viscosa TaxID=80854 RepID=UPI0009125B85|nr:TadE/TadG family type IV pilus assembly protein [Moritella viscosa]SGY85503.1 Membrane associated secretion system protein [Moritella viscosa]
MMKAYYKRQQGHAALLFVMIVPVLFGIFALATDGVRALQSKARLGDAAEVAILTIAAKNADNTDVDFDGAGSRVNRDIATRVISNYFYNQDTILPQDLKISKLACSDIPECLAGLERGENRFNEYCIEARTKLNTWFPGNESIVGFGDTFTVGHAAKARKYVNKTVDVVFVADFSGSMDWDWEGNNGIKKVDALKNAMKNIVEEVEKFDEITDGNNKVGIVPFNYYTADFHGNQVENYTQNAYQTINQIWQLGTYQGQGNPYFYEIPLTNDYKNFITRFNQFRAYGGTSSYEGIIRGAQMLNEGKNARRLLIVLSDGADTSRDRHKDLNDGEYCQIIKQGLSKGKNKKGENYTAKLAVIGFGYDLENNIELARCVGVDNVYKAESEQDILDRILELISEEIGHLK